MQKAVIQRLAILMDSIEGINTEKDSTYALLQEANQRGIELYYCQQGDLTLKNGQVALQLQRLYINEKIENNHWFQLESPQQHNAQFLDALLMRKDPPFNMEYIYSTHLLDLLSKQGCLVFNRPNSIRAYNEKLFACHFPDLMPPSLVSRRMEDIKHFLNEQKKIVVKPLDGMGGSMIFQLSQGDPNVNVILETITQYGQRTIMAQRFLPEFKHGDKRILLIDGEAFPYGLLRKPAEGESRANLAAGAKGVGEALTEREIMICQKLAPVLREQGLLFVGLDVIGGWVTEINVTSPTGIRELERIYSVNIAGMWLDALNRRFQQSCQ